MIKFFLKIPFYILKIIEKLKLEKYSKTFPEYIQAKKYCDNINANSYENEELNFFRYEKFINNLNLIPNTYNNSHKLLLEIFLIYFHLEKTFPKVLDIGGGFGENQIYLKQLLNKDLIYDVVESKKVADLAKSKNLNHSKFFSAIPAAGINFDYDIIFSSGTIQYFEKPYEIINQIFSSKAKFVGLTRNNFSENAKIYSQPTLIEHHGAREGNINFKYKKSKKIILPNTQIKENELLKIAEKCNYKLLRKSKGIEGNVGKDSYTSDLIFQINN